MLKADVIRLRHMLEAGTDAIKFIAGRTRTDLDTARMLALSVIKSIEIIGEAANKVTSECKEVFPNIPWMDINGMRNRLIHAYFGVDLDIVWQTVTNELPTLALELTEALAEES